MVRSMKRPMQRVYRCEPGFTLIEMMVVVGIIAVLAAVIFPNIGKFIGSGEQGAKDAEYEAVQTAINAMMADMTIVTLVAQGTGSNSSNDWTALPAMDPADLPTTPNVAADMYLVNYLQSPNTV